MLSLAPSTSASAGTFRTTDSVRLRSEPSTEANVVTVLQAGTNVDVRDHNPAGWSSVTVGNSTGFIRSDFLRFPISGTATFRTTSGVNVRSSASTTSNVLSTVIAGTSVEVSEHDPAGWSKVSVNGTSGFIRSDFLTRGGDGSAAHTTTVVASASTSSAIGTLRTTGSVNLRAGASTNDRIISTLSARTSVEVLENQANGWSRVRHNGTDGFIRSDLLSESGAASAASTTLRTNGTVNLRSGPSTNNSIVKTLSAGTSVEVLEQQSNGWSRVRHNNTDGFIRSDLISQSGGGAGSTLRTLTGVHFRTGPSTGHSSIEVLAVNTAVEVLENLSSGWSRVRYNGTEGFISTKFLGTGIRPVEVIEWADARRIIPRGRDLRVVDVRTGISYNIRAFSLGNHADVDTASQADTDAKRRTRNGVWSWAPRPVWVTVGDRTFAAAINGMPHAGSSVSGNGLSGHFCLHFRGSTSHTSNSASLVRNMQNAITEAHDKRPR